MTNYEKYKDKILEAIVCCKCLPIKRGKQMVKIACLLIGIITGLVLTMVVSVLYASCRISSQISRKLDEWADKEDWL